MGSISGDSLLDWERESQDSSPQEEKIFVAVRLRPLNERELSKNDASDWECINSTTIIFKNSLQERSLLPTAYTFDRVFGWDSPTKQVYEEAAKKIALSVLSGMNSTIFAYGQTSSGKTYTMTGITEYSVADIYDYIDKHTEREFVLKFSAMEIYNEAVKDLLCSDGTPLRLLDDPERGTVVDKLTEVTLRDSNHFIELLSICEAQRQIGETMLNEVSSRSHQILRLTVESEARGYFGGNSSTLTASVNFVDLAGSERASQTHSAGTRLKEGCHINRSLLTLGTVIRKLSKGRNAHIPYRDSKLTRILQSSLGGNARTAIICTMSPAHSHMEQSRNTLLFASCAKQVNTNAQVNVVMSEKALVKQLQRELARLESELKNVSTVSASSGGDSASALREKELLIEKMDKEIRELTHQRDLAQARVEEMLRSGVDNQASNAWVYMNNNKHQKKDSWTDSYPASEESEIIDPEVASRKPPQAHKRHDSTISSKMMEQFTENVVEDQFLSSDMSPRLYIDKYFGPDPCQGWEKIADPPQTNNNKLEYNYCKEVQCIEIDIKKGNVISSSSSSPEMASHFSDIKKGNVISSSSSPQEISSHFSDVKKGNVISSSSSPQEISSHFSAPSPCSSSNDESDRTPVVRSKSCSAILTTSASFDELVKEDEEEEEKEKDSSRYEPENQETLPSVKSVIAQIEKKRRQDSQDSVIERDSPNEEEKNIRTSNEDNKNIMTSNEDEKNVMTSNEDEKNIMTPNEDEKNIITPNEDEKNIITPNEDEKNIVTLNEECKDKQQEACVKELNEVIQPKALKEVEYESLRMSPLKEKQEEKKPEKPEETADENSVNAKAPETEQSASPDWSIEFERQKKEIIQLWDECHTPLVHRTYFFLLFKGDPSDSVYLEVELRRLSFLKNSKHGVVKDDQIYKEDSSVKALNREREMLSRKMLKKLSTKEREDLYQKWGIDLKSKQRRLQLSRQLWTEPTNMDHISESAAIVAKLVGFKETGRAPKEMFGLSFLPKLGHARSFSWTAWI